MKQIILFICILAFILTVNAACTDGQVEATITKINGNYCREESVSIYPGTTTTTTPIFTRGWTTNDYIKQTTVDTICIIPGTTYIAELTDSYGDGWDPSASLSIIVDEITVLDGVRLTSGSSGLILFHLNL